MNEFVLRLQVMRKIFDIIYDIFIFICLVRVSKINDAVVNIILATFNADFH